MKIRPLSLEVFLVVLIQLLAPGASALAADPPDSPAPGGRFYTQASGSLDPSLGFSIVDTAGIPFRTAFEGRGGVTELGYPASTRFLLNGFVAQATQRAILQWQPQTGEVVPANIFDLLHDRGFDPWLQAMWQIPPPSDTGPDTGLAWQQVQERHLALLDISPAIKARYLADSDPLGHFGLPMSSEDLGSLLAVRAQRAAFQEWRINTPWANAGEVTLTNSGDIAKAAGLVPQEATVAESPPPPGPLALDAVATKAKPSVVKVTLPGVEGSGVVFDPAGYLVTNNHVVEGGGPVTVSTSKGDLPARVVGVDPVTDLAVLKVEAEGLPALSFGDSDALAPGEEVVAIGFSPILPDPPNVYNARVLRLVGTLAPADGHPADFVQTTAPLHPGDSGGPLLNLWGQVVGINSALIFPRRALGDVLASSIAINRARPILTELVAKGRVTRPWIGATVHVVIPGFLGGAEPAVAEGLVVLSVVPGSPGAEAGLQPGDILTAADGSALALPSDLLEVLSGHRLGETLTLGVVGPSGETRTLQVTLGEAP